MSREESSILDTNTRRLVSSKVTTSLVWYDAARVDLRGRRVAASRDVRGVASSKEFRCPMTR
jgi:hypothetical protein